MNNTLLKAHLGNAKIGEADVVVSVGEITTAIGEKVDLRIGNEITRGLRVIDRVISQIINIPESFLDVFECTNFGEFRRKISAAVGTGLPAEAKVTIFVLGKEDPQNVVSSEEVVVDPTNIVDLVFSIEDSEDDEEEEL